MRPGAREVRRRLRRPELVLGERSARELELPIPVSHNSNHETTVNRQPIRMFRTFSAARSKGVAKSPEGRLAKKLPPLKDCASSLRRSKERGNSVVRPIDRGAHQLPADSPVRIAGCAQATQSRAATRGVGRHRPDTGAVRLHGPPFRLFPVPKKGCLDGKGPQAPLQNWLIQCLTS